MNGHLEDKVIKGAIMMVVAVMECWIAYVLYSHCRAHWKQALLVRFGVGIILAVLFVWHLRLNFFTIFQITLYWPLIIVAGILSAIPSPFKCVDTDTLHCLPPPVLTIYAYAE